jgi:hypothetical protein
MTYPIASFAHHQLSVHSGLGPRGAGRTDGSAFETTLDQSRAQTEPEFYSTVRKGDFADRGIRIVTSALGGDLGMTSAALR